MGEEHNRGFFKTPGPELSRDRPVFGAGGLILPGAKAVKPDGKTEGSPPGESKFRRAAKFLLLVGGSQEQAAAEILSRLPPDQVEAISREIASIDTVGVEEVGTVLDEFGSLLSSPCRMANPSPGGVEAARRVLYAAFGPERGERFLLKAVPEAKPNPFDFLEDFSGADLAMLFKEESPSAAAMVFSRLPPKLAAEALASVSGEKKLAIVRRIAKQAAVAPEVLEQTALALREKAKRLSAHIGRDNSSFNGMEALAAILKSSGPGFGDKMLTQLEQEDPELGKALKDQVYTLADLLGAVDLPVQKKLASMDDRDIILLLKARTGYGDAAAFRGKILGNLSRGRRETILEAEGIAGAVPRRDVEAAAAEFLAWFRRSREEGSLVMMKDDLII
ncbi:MAG: flagellar motor switch protein FliG [Treponema sp.]|nr:flagellar motor switch protein FliG [Treponema sp.]